MAVYYNLCVDCGDDALLADSLASRFDGFVLQVEGHDDVRCKSLRTSERGIQFVGAEPVGMGYATLPESLRRPELTEPDAIETIRDTLYNELKRFPGFRRAIFGAECWDQLVFATVDEDADIDFGWMIFSTKTFPNDPDECVIEQYIDGYRMVVRRKTAT